MAGTTFLQLIGSPSENFYLLGKEDKLAAPRPSLPLASPPPHLALLNFFLKTPVKTLLHAALERYPTLKEHLTAYAEGREEEVTSIAWPLALPDFYPLLLRANQELPLPLASAATFLLPYENGLAHFKTHNTSYALNENQKLRLINFAAPHYPGILTWSYPGHPYPQGQAWTTEGLCASWHYLPTDKFNPHGQPLCEMLWQLLNNAHDLKSAKIFLKTCQVFTAASIILTDQSGQIEQVIMEGNRHIVRTPRGKDFYYFNRHEALPLPPRSLLRPLKEHYQQQKRTAQTFLAATKDLAAPAFWPELLNPALPGIWQATTIACAALQTQQLEIAHLTAAQPAHYQISWQALKTPAPAATQPAFTLADPCLAVHAISLSDGPRAYTLAIEAATEAWQRKDYLNAHQALAQALAQAPQAASKDLLAMFLALNRYFLLPPRPRQAWRELKAQLKTLRAQLPAPWPDHLALFIARINKILELPSPRLKVSSPALRRIMTAEEHLPPAVFLNTTRFLTQLRPDILEIVYTHTT